ncbi:iron ascorbate-dependent oxidoreductase [Stylosanthes scabra]|uniref:Iron ascorbate-dependent oxidoreductase n=1 Tax=Stylosanthes scabra TaxID=79078 RepID=A0ABU6THW5_9FABA|nr:iron ascorbate-dependent oxidoreductase [Stylosanthes scabra]
MGTASVEMVEKDEIDECETTRGRTLRVLVDKWYERKATYWKQLLKSKFASSMDRNTKFFHAIAKSNGRWKGIESIKINHVVTYNNNRSTMSDAMKKFQDESIVLVEKLIRLSFKYLGISKGNWIGPNNHTSAIQLDSYPICPKPENAIGIAPHTDTSIFTLIHQSQSSGLQFSKDGSSWFTVPLEPNTVVINTGDVLHILSNARFKLAPHRVIVNNIKHRYSMVVHYRPIMDHVISPLVQDNTHD